MLSVSSSTLPSRPLTGFHRFLFSGPMVFQYVVVVFGMANHSLARGQAPNQNRCTPTAGCNFEANRGGWPRPFTVRLPKSSEPFHPFGPTTPDTRIANRYSDLESALPPDTEACIPTFPETRAFIEVKATLPASSLSPQTIQKPMFTFKIGFVPHFSSRRFLPPSATGISPIKSFSLLGGPACVKISKSINWSARCAFYLLRSC